MGGVDGNNNDLSSVESLNPSSNVQCQNMKDMPTNRYNYISNNHWICGGFEGGSYSKSCWFMNDKYEWEISSMTLPYTLTDAPSIMVNNHEWWITGGNHYHDDGEPISNTILIDIHQQTVTSHFHLPEIMSYHCMAKINQSTVLIAGNAPCMNCRSDGKSSYLVDISSKPFQFGQRKSLMEQRWGAGCGVLPSFGGKSQVMIVVGGANSAARQTTEVFDEELNQWKPGPRLLRGFYCGGFLSNPLILIGGWVENDITKKDIMWYNPLNETFQYLPGELKTARAFFNVISVNKDAC